MTAGRLLDCFPLVRTQNVEELYAALEQIYAKPMLGPAARTAQVDAALNYLPLSYMRFGNTRYGIGTNLAYPESELIMQSFPISGRGAVTDGAFDCALDAENGMITTPGMTFTAQLDASYETIILLIKPQVLAEKLATIAGKDVGGPLRFAPVQDYTRREAKALRDHVLSVVAMLSVTAELPPALLLAEFEDSLAMTFLQANQHNYSHWLRQEIATPALRQVRQVEEFIEANWQRPITLEALVAVTGTSALSLSRAFKKSRGYSPLEFVRRVRLSHAHEMLRRPRAMTSVAAVTVLCGYADQATFERDYVAAFGEWPAETLRRGRSDGFLQ